jgi:4-oxalocrotonate tautomerase
MPTIIVEAFEGRTLDQRRDLAKGITEVVAKVYKVEPSAVTIKFRDQSKQDVARAGKLACD